MITFTIKKQKVKRKKKNKQDNQANNVNLHRNNLLNSYLYNNFLMRNKLKDLFTPNAKRYLHIFSSLIYNNFDYNYTYTSKSEL